MKNLSTVIRALEQCHQDIKYRDCDCCEYASAGSECERCLMKDALDLLKDYRRRLGKCHNCAHGSLCVDEDGEYIGCDVKDLDKCNPFGNCPCWEPKEWTE